MRGCAEVRRYGYWDVLGRLGARDCHPTQRHRVRAPLSRPLRRRWWRRRTRPEAPSSCWLRPAALTAQQPAAAAAAVAARAAVLAAVVRHRRRRLLRCEVPMSASAPATRPCG